ncbi:MAG: MFS transporter [Ruminococcus sp.]|jgi:fucose permease|nr:MFS transporter [Ruminococcus sp.]
MFTLLLILIFAAFISLGLPDSLFGAAWPSISAASESSNTLAGIYSFIASSATIVSSVFAGRLINKLGTGKVVIVSILITAAALIAMPLAVDMPMPFPFICGVGFFLGLGGGAADAALNSYVSTHYSARVMTLLYCFWGLGTAASPLIYAYILNFNGNWEEGYLAIAAIQIIIATALIFAFPMWDKLPLTADSAALDELREEQGETSRYRDIIKMRGMKSVGFALMFYCGYEAVVGLWAATYIYKIRGTGLEAAAQFASLYYFGSAAGRIVSGFLVKRIPPRLLGAAGSVVSVIGVVLLLLPLADIWAACALFLIGFGSGPFYPGVMFRIPRLSGAKNAAAATGLALVFAYTGFTVFPAAAGLFPIELFPGTVLTLIIAAAVFHKLAFSVKVSYNENEPI